MAVYTVHAPRLAEGETPDPAELVFVKDGFCWPALFIPVVWLIWRGLWLALLIYLVLVIGLASLAGFAGSDASTAVMVLFAVWFALEANGLRRWTLERHRHQLVGVVEGRTREEAERRFFGEEGPVAVAVAPVAAALEPAPTPAPANMAEAKPVAATPTPPPLPKRAPAIVGLFPTPGGNR